MIDRRMILAGLAGAPLVGCTTIRPSQSITQTIKLATFNIYHDRGDWTARQPLVIQTLREIDADVIGLQEVLQDDATGLPNQARTLADALGYQVYFSSMDAEASPRRYGNAILTRLPIIDRDWTPLEPLDDFRTAQRVRVQVGSESIDIVNTHLHHTPAGATIRSRQIETLLTWLGDRDVPLAILGDLNAPIDNPEMASLRAPRFVHALTALRLDLASRTTLNPAFGHSAAHIDHILVETDGFHLVAAAISGDRPTGATYPSDHFAVSATVRLI